VTAGPGNSQKLHLSGAETKKPRCQSCNFNITKGVDSGIRKGAQLPSRLENLHISSVEHVSYISFYKVVIIIITFVSNVTQIL